MAQTLILSQDIADGEVITASLGADAVTTAKITDLNVTTAKLANDAVTSAKIAAGTIVNSDVNASAAIDGSKLAADSVTATQIAADAVTASELADDAVDTAAILDANVTLAKVEALTSAEVILGNASNRPTATALSGDITISNAGVTTIGALTIETGMLEDSVVETNKILNLAVTTGKIAASNVTLAKMANDSVDAAQIMADAVGTSELDLTAAYALSGSCSFTQQLTIPATPASDTDAASKGYVDGLVEGLTWKAAARVHSTSNITVSSPGAAIDGVTLANNDRVLLSGQSTGSEDGLYVFNGNAAAMTRTADGDVYADLDHAAVFIMEGTSADEGFTQTVTLSSFSGQVWVQFSGAGNIVAGEGLTKSGNTINMGTFTGVTLNADTSAINYGAAGAIVTLLPDAAASAGVADTSARSDHGHAIAAATAVDVGTANSEGTSSSFSRADHVHQLGAGSVDASNLFGAGVVDAAAIGANAVGASELADDAVDTAAILDANVTLAKMAADSVNSSKIVDASIMLADLNSEVTNAMSGFTSRSSIVMADNTAAYSLPANFPAADYKGLVFMNGRLMREGASNDYTIAAGTITFDVNRYSDDVCEVIYDSTAA